MKNTGTFQEMIKPLIVMVVICLTVAVLLGLTNSVTAPIIEENTRKLEEETRISVLDGAKSFTQIECDEEALGITGAYREDNGKGYVITAASKGYGGLVTVTVGLDDNGKIVGLSANVSTETSGVGSKAGKSDYTGKFIGLTGNCNSVDKISNATYSSTAVKNGVNAALSAFETVKKGGAVK